jgi:hypothetical protein
MRDAFARHLGVQSLDLVEHEIHTRRHDQSVITQMPIRQHDGLLVRIDRGDLTLDQLDAVLLLQRAVAHSQVFDRTGTTEHGVAHRAGDEIGVALDQHHLDLVVAPFADVLGGGRTAEATTHHHHALALFLDQFAGCEGHARERSDCDTGDAGLQKITTTE